MKLYYVQAEQNGENFDWMVVANDRAEAVDLWSKQEMVDDFGLTETDVNFVRVILEDVSPTPYAGAARVIEWSEIRIED